MEGNFILNLVTSVGTVSAVGVIFFMWLNTKFQTIDKNMANISRDVERLDETLSRVVNKEDYSNLRKEDKESMTKIEDRLEKQINGIKEELRSMPRTIVEMLKPLLK